MAMTLTQCAKLLDRLSMVDNRVIGPETVVAWHEIVGHLDYDTAVTAMNDARRVVAIEYIEPRHIIQYATAAAGRQARALRIEAAVTQARPEAGGAPRPDNFDSLTAAYQTHDPIAVQREISIYKAQLADAGYPNDFTAAPVVQ